MLNANDFNKKQIIFLIPKDGDKLTFSNDNIVVKDKNGKIKYQSTCYRLFMLCIVGNVSITSGLIQRSKKFGFSICLMTTSFKVYEVMGARMEGNTLLRTNQYKYNGKEIGTMIEKNKIANQSVALKKIRNRNDYLNEGISILDNLANSLDSDMDYLCVMGIEGNAAKVYFPRMFDNVS